MPSPVVASGLTFAWPDGRVVLDGLDLVISPGRTGLIGRSGAGKSTLLRLIAGQLAPSRGSVAVSGSLGYLPQDVTLQAGRRAGEVLGVAGVSAALAAIEAGDSAPEHVAVIGDAWDAPARARALLDRLGLAHVGLGRQVGELSGGESVLLALAARLVRRPDVLLLDEPTNNLDLDARQVLCDAVGSWRGVLVLVSHDQELLERADTIVELYEGAARSFGAPLPAYEAALAAEQEAAQRQAAAAGSDLRRQQRELAQARIKLDRRQRYGRKLTATTRAPKIIMNERKRQAQASAGKHRNLQLDRVQQAADRLAEAQGAVRDDDEIRVDLPATAVPARRTVLILDGVRPRFGPRVTLHLRGPERVALTGRNGAGKTTLLRTISGELTPLAGAVRLEVPARLLPQRLDVLDPELSVAANAARFAPRASPNAIRASLARLLFPGARADQVVATLSGGELFRATLAALLLAEPPPQLLLLDEPTNSLDRPSVRQLTEALRGYRGALLVASHDVPFLRGLELTRWLRHDDALRDIDPL
jgi:ATPase subunit of ABC transporter with duplicated ATPase domains